MGLLAPLDAPHHMKKYERMPYREGAHDFTESIRPIDTGCSLQSGLNPHEKDNPSLFIQRGYESGANIT